MKDVAKGERTILFVSHNMGAISQMCSRGVVLEQGKVALSDTALRCIERYLQVDSESLVLFDPKESSALNFDSVRLTNSHGVTTKNFRYDELICIEMVYRNTSADPRIELGVRVLSQEGFAVFTTHRLHNLSAPVPRGVNMAHVTIPGRFLTPGNYSVTLAAHIPHVEVLDLKEASVAFRIEETGSQFSRYANDRYGVVFCTCVWEDRPFPIASASKTIQ
jgi:lipopolysaccharide transport system ATP-binding protein